MSCEIVYPRGGCNPSDLYSCLKVGRKGAGMAPREKLGEVARVERGHVARRSQSGVISRIPPKSIGDAQRREAAIAGKKH
jgi:hypothetical protein